MKATVQAPIVYWFDRIQDLADAPEPYRSRFGDGPRRITRNTAGPVDGRSGLLATPGTDWLLAYCPARQTWHQLAETVWIGVGQEWDPSQFKRGEGPGGSLVLLGGKPFAIPCCNPEVELCHLPCVPWRAGSRIVYRVRSDYASLAEQVRAIAAEMTAAVLQRQDYAVDTAEALQVIADAIATNYRLTLDELLALEVLDERSQAAAMLAITGWLGQRDRLAAAIAHPQE